MTQQHLAIFDTNLFVGAGFKPCSASAQLMQRARSGQVTLIWDIATQSETLRVLTKIPRLSWSAVQGLFVPENQWTSPTDLQAVKFVSDPQDRKFAALSQASGATLVSSDRDLLDHRTHLDVLTPSEYLALLPASV